MASAPEPSREIPITLAASLKSWWRIGSQSSSESEERILRRLPYYAVDDHPSGVVARSSQVPIANSQFINTVTFTPSKPPSETPPVVVLHGYGAGLAFFYRNFPALGAWAASRRTPVYAIDWLGMGRSSRPPFKIRAAREDTAARVHEAESFFIDSFEEWRQKVGLERMTLVGHSLGGYLSVAYALRYPHRVGRIVLLSPAGVPSDPENSEAPARELDPSPHETPGDANANAPLGGSRNRAKRIHSEQARKKERQSRTRRLFTYLWEEGWSPFQVVRSSSIFAPLLVGKYSSRRFTGLTEEETRDMHDYILNITLAKGSGEYSISHLLAPGAIARMPLVDRVAPLKMPITFVYGDHDWMDPMGGYQAVHNLKMAGNRSCKMVVIPNAGHHVYLDNSRAVNELLCTELDKTLE